MPLYEYVCEKCGKKTEIIQRVGDRPPRACPHCGGKMKKLASAPAIQFKGSGFYITDYARGSAAGASSKSEAKEESKGESKSESKSDASAESKSESAGKSEKVEKKEKKEKKASKD